MNGNFEDLEKVMYASSLGETLQDPVSFDGILYNVRCGKIYLSVMGGYGKHIFALFEKELSLQSFIQIMKFYRDSKEAWLRGD